MFSTAVEILLQVKPDSLCQGQGCTVIDCVCLPPHIGFPGITAAFPSTSGFLFTAKCPADFSPAGADIDIGNSAVAARL